MTRAKKQRKAHSEWPKWLNGPNGQRRIFQRAEEVPADWEEGPSPAPEPVREPEPAKEPEPDAAAIVDASLGVSDEKPDPLVELTDEERGKLVAKLADENRQDDLAAILEDMNKAREEEDQIEFLPNWPKVRLVETIFENDGYARLVKE